MNTIEISYDLKVDQSVEAYRKIIDAIYSLGQVQKKQYSTFVLATNSDCVNVRNYLMNFIENGDSLDVVQIVAYATHNVPKAATDLIDSAWATTVEPIANVPKLSVFAALQAKKTFQNPLLRNIK